MIIGFTTNCAISAYHHLSCEFELVLLQLQYLNKCSFNKQRQLALINLYSSNQRL